MRRFIGTVLLVITFVAGGTVVASAAALPTCKSVDLDITSIDRGAAAGTSYREIKFTMRRLGACVLKGFPGVSYVDRADAQVGNPARRIGAAGDLITLAYGASVSATVGFANPGNYDPEVCQPQPVWGIKVFPPDEFVPLYVGYVDEVGCGGTSITPLSVTAVLQS
ncbi:DUF4232 domain-containing protein [Lentzea alba]|uniref:DUF4232 domain-containing protein n=1 Tax=Lentzea alba TaxID=2714351 RepID=UPI0039BF0FFF